MTKEQKKPAKRTMPEIQLISDEEYERTMKRLMDIQIAADNAIKAINNLRSIIAATSL